MGKIQGVDPALAQRYSDRQWRILTHPRSLALGRYRRGEDSYTGWIPLSMHNRTVEKPGFVLVEVDNSQGAGPWEKEVE